MKKFIFVVLLMLATVACDVNPSKVAQADANRYADKITYFKDTNTDVCFGVVASRKTGSTDQTGLGITSVPCAKVGL